MASPDESELIIPFIRSCEKETSEPIEGTISGEIPSWLQGSLIRNGSGLLHVGKDKYNHLFDGLALLRQFTVKDGRVTYRNKFLRSDTYRKNMKANRIVVSELGTPGVPDPCKTIFQKIASLFSAEDISDNDLINVVNISGEYYAMSETNFIWKIDPENLDALKKEDITKYVPVKTAVAHPHEDKDGSLYNIGTTMTLHAYYTVFKIPPKETASSNPLEGAKVISSIPSSQRLHPSYYHSFGMSENYIVLLEQSLKMSMTTLVLRFITTSAYEDCLEWKPETKSRFIVVRRDNGAVISTRYLADPLMVFHHINAYEDDGHLVVDMCCYEDGKVVKDLYVEALRKAAKDPKTPFIKAQAKRYVLPLNVKNDKSETGKNLVQIPGCSAKAVLQKDGTVHCDPEISVRPETWYTELPRINYDYNGKKYKYFYGIGKRDNDEEDYLVKVNMQDGTLISWNSTKESPSEPVFVPSKDPKSEDDGVIVASLLCKLDEKIVTFVVLDAKTMTELGRSVFHTESAVPADFHGVFIKKE